MPKHAWVEPLTTTFKANVFQGYWKSLFFYKDVVKLGKALYSGHGKCEVDFMKWRSGDEMRISISSLGCAKETVCDKWVPSSI